MQFYISIIIQLFNNKTNLSGFFLEFNVIYIVFTNKTWYKIVIGLTDYCQTAVINTANSITKRHITNSNKKHLKTKKHNANEMHYANHIKLRSNTNSPFPTDF